MDTPPTDSLHLCDPRVIKQVMSKTSPGLVETASRLPHGVTEGGVVCGRLGREHQGCTAQRWGQHRRALPALRQGKTRWPRHQGDAVKLLRR